MNTEIKQYGNSFRFRLLKWLHPILMTLILGLFWEEFFSRIHAADLNGDMVYGACAAYIVVLCYFEKVYNALTVGLLRVSELIYSQGLALLICNVLCYLAESYYAHALVSPLPLIGCYLVQMILSIAWSHCVNRIYFAKYPAPGTAIIYEDESELQKILSIKYFEDHFRLVRLLKGPFDTCDEVFPKLEDVQVLFIAGCSGDQRNEIAKYCVKNSMRGYFLPHIGEIIMSGAEHMSMFSEPVMMVQKAQTKTGYIAVKRCMDLFASLVGLIIASPIMLATALAIKIYDKGPVFYRQKRLTQNGRVFSIYKFRSMNVNAEKDGVARLASENDSRITPVGKFIRATRIDELPQLLNILIGDMSVIGPRPERPEIAAEYEKELPEFALRLQVKAGLSGLAQVYGRYNTEPYSKLQMDLMYINKISLITDIRLMFATVKILFMKESTEGIQEGQRTAADDARKREKRSA